ncbi:MAG TPA: hypothetical protein VK989_00625 [Polyangia bacterium]|nr:hypothetical protein [Polyangia bacterium]
MPPSTVASVIARAVLMVTAGALAAACGPMVDNARFPVRPDSVRPADLLGPYDGIVLDADTDRPISGAVVAASWAFERGIGLQAPLASREIVVESGVDGRYAIPRLTDLPDANVPGGMSTRLRRFTLVVYKRGHVAWRSDRRFDDGGRRRDFSQLGNRARLEKWQQSYRHADHLVFLGGGDKIRAAAAWELQPAALELDGEKSSAIAEAEAASTVGTKTPLDIEHLLSDDEIRGVTGFVGKFEDGKLTDLPTTEFYDSRHFKAVGKPEGYDVGLRVWRLGAAAADAQYRKLLDELPGAHTTDEVGDASLRARSGEINGLAFLVRERGVVASLTCGAAQCPEAAQLLKLAKLVESRLPDLPPEPAPAVPPAPEGTTP